MGEGMGSRGKWMGPEDSSRIGKRKVGELCGPDGARRSVAVTSGAVSFGIWRNQVGARRTGVTSLNIQGTGANLGHRAIFLSGLISTTPSLTRYIFTRLPKGRIRISPALGVGLFAIVVPSASLLRGRGRDGNVRKSVTVGAERRKTAGRVG